MRKLHAQRKHVLLVGEEGMGKTALIEHLQLSLPLLVCSQSGSFQAICRSLNSSSGLHSGRRILPRQSELLSVLTKANKPVVFDGLGWTNLKLSSFFECVAKHGPVWICCRSAELWDFGFYKPFLWKFVRVELGSFCLSETRDLVEAVIKAMALTPIPADEIQRLHSLSCGNPRVLSDLIESLPRERRPESAVSRALP